MQEKITETLENQFLEPENRISLRSYKLQKQDFPLVEDKYLTV